MTYVETISEYQAKGEVARTYAAIRDHLGALPAVFRLMSADERILTAAWRAYPYAMENGSLGRAERELLALAVSRTNSCRYGMDGATHRYVLHPPRGEPVTLRTKQEGLPVPAGSVFHVQSGGGGGWGDPAERTPEERAADDRAGLPPLHPI